MLNIGEVVRDFRFREHVVRARTISSHQPASHADLQMLEQHIATTGHFTNFHYCEPQVFLLNRILALEWL